MTMKEHMRYKADTTPPRSHCEVVRSRTQNIKVMFSYLDFRCHFKANAQNHIYLPRDLGESLRRRRRRRRSAFIYHTFIHTHNLLHYYKVGNQDSVEVEGVEEQMLIFSSSLTPGRVEGS